MADPLPDGIVRTRHVPELQSVRGLAAATVMIHHCSFYFRSPRWFRGGSEFLLNAHGAVVLFYVLSGYVLALAFDKPGPLVARIETFYVRRLFRIFPALWAACAFATLYVIVFSGRPFPPSVSPWFLEVYRAAHPNPLKIVAGFAAMSHAIPVPVWSIFVELLGSALMPVFVLAARWPLAWLACLIASVVLSFAGGMDWPMWSGGFFACFVLGVGLARRGVAWWQRRAGTGPTVLLAIVGLAGLDFGRQPGGWNFDHFYTDPTASLIETGFATLLVGAVAARPEAFAWLRARALVWLGDISYSLYLLHLPIMAFVAAIGWELIGMPPPIAQSGTVSSLVLIALVVPLALIASHWSFRWIERPGIALGARAIAARRR